MLSIWEQPGGSDALQGATLVLPVVSVGNVGQLAADLLINSLKLPRTARLQDDALLPAVGGRAYSHVDGLATAMELYQEQQPGGVAVAQQRAAAAPGTQTAFAERLAAFIKQSGVKEVLVLGSLEAMVRRDAQLAGPQLRCWALLDADAGGGGSGDAGSAALLERCRASGPGGGVPALEPSFWEERPVGARSLPPWPLLRALRAAGVPCAALLCFATEGDNAGDANVMATAAAAAADLAVPAAAAGGAAATPAGMSQWVPPPSWQHLSGGPSTAVY